MAAPVPDSYSAPSGTPINAGRWPAAQYAATAVKSSNVVGDATPGDTVTYTVNLTKTGSADLLSAVLADEIDDGNLALVPGSATTDVGTVTQDDTRVEVAVGTLSTAAQITYQAVINASMPDSLVSNRALLTSARVVPTLSNLHHDTVIAATPSGPAWDNLGFELDVLGAGNSASPAASWVNADAWNPSGSGITPVEGANVGRINSGGTFIEASAVNATGSSTDGEAYEFTYNYRRQTQAGSTHLDIIKAGIQIGTAKLVRELTCRIDDPAKDPWIPSSSGVAVQNTGEPISLIVTGENDTNQNYLFDDFQVTTYPVGTYHPMKEAPMDLGTSLPTKTGWAILAEPKYYGMPSLTEGDSIQSIRNLIPANENAGQYVQSSFNQRPKYSASEQSLLFDGIDDYLPMPVAGEEANIPSGPWTIVYRCKPTSNKAFFMFQMPDGVSDDGIGHTTSGSALFIKRAGVRTDLLTGYFPTWLNVDHVVVIHMTADGQNCYAYVWQDGTKGFNNIVGYLPLKVNAISKVESTVAYGGHFWGAVGYAGAENQSHTDLIANFLMGLGT